MKINLPMFIGSIVIVLIGFGMMFFHFSLREGIVLIMNSVTFFLLVSILDILKEIDKKIDDSKEGKING